MAGYSGTPLPKKLGIVEGSTLALLGEPSGVVAGLPAGVTVKRQARGKADVVVAFFTERRDFEGRVDALGRMIFPAGGLWVAWPKRSSGKRHHHGRERGACFRVASGPGRQQGVRHRRDLDCAAPRVAARTALNARRRYFGRGI